jgi:hypothetical protein
MKHLYKLATAVLAVVALMSAMTLAADARVFVGTKKANNVTGTNKGDKIRLGAGNDRASGRGGADRISGAAGKDRLNGDSGRDALNGGSGNDRLNGGSGNDNVAGASGNDNVAGGSGNDRVSGSSGRDRLSGGKGKDRLSGGSGNDYLNAADGKKDAAVDGGSGTNKCKIDAADLPIVKHCGSVAVAPAASGSPTAPGNGSPGGVGLPGSPGGPGGNGAPGTVSLVQGTGLQCDATTPSCSFSLTLAPGSTPIGDVLGQLGLEANGGTSLLGVSPLVQVGDNVVAGGAYACTESGVLVVVFRDQRIEIPVSCDTP